jgi:hypothetical protein
VLSACRSVKLETVLVGLAAWASPGVKNGSSI